MSISLEGLSRRARDAVFGQLDQISSRVLDQVEDLLLRSIDGVRNLQPRLVPDATGWKAFARMPRDAFLAVFEPYVRRLGCPPTSHILSFYVGLPFDMRVRKGAAYTHRVGSGAACTVTVHRNIVSQRVPALAILPERPGEPIWRKGQAVAELLGYVSDGDENLVTEGFSPEALSHMFDQMLIALNSYIAGYMLATRDTSVHQVGIRSLPPVAYFQLWAIDEWNRVTGGLFLTSMAKLGQMPLDEIGPQETQKMLHAAQLYERRANPFLHAELHLIRAEAVETDGDHRRCIMEANTGIEVFLSALFRELALEDGVSPTEIDEKLAGGRNFLSLVTREFHPRLGGAWDLSREDTRPGEWYREVYRPRCRVVHAGHCPTYEEASRALDAAMRFRAWLIERVRQVRRRYPRTAVFFEAPSYPEELFLVNTSADGSEGSWPV